jgi:hypothetical protein
MDSVQGLDPSRQCTHHNEQGRCVSRSMLGETRCPAHSDSAAAASMRERMVVRDARSELDRAGAQGLTYNPLIGSLSSRAVGSWTERAPSESAPSRASAAKRSRAEDEVHKMLFRGDITTGEGLIRLSERLVREFAAGKLAPRRFEILMRAVRLMAALRRQFPAPPIDEPAEQQAAAVDEALVVEADRRPAAERAEELKQEHRRPSPGRSAVRTGSVSAEPEPSIRPPEPVIAGDYKAKRRGEPSRRPELSASRRGESRQSRSESARRLRFAPPHRSRNRDTD